MSEFQPAHDLAQGFAQHVEWWSLEAGATPEDAALAARAARALSLAVSEGHACLPLQEMDEPAALRARLPASRVVGTPQAPGAMPLVLDGERLYLHRWFDLERRLARRLVQARQVHLDDAVTPRTRALLRELFPGEGTGPADEVHGPRLAAGLALRGALLLASGPRTARHALAAPLLGCLLAQAPASRIALAAPTAQAAAQLGQALREHGARLPPDLRALLPTQAATVHRLLDGQGDGRFTFHASHWLPLDVLVVDEASRLALPLATRLLEAVPPGARIVLLGDRHQLAAVEGGAVFAEICAEPALGPGCVVELPRQPRSARESAVDRLAEAVVAGELESARALLQAARAAMVPDLAWLPDASADLEEAARRRLLQGFRPYLAALRRDACDAAAVVAALDGFRVLAALRQGPRGAAALDALVAAQVRSAVGAPAQALWYAGRAVQLTRNDEAQGLSNGDVGIALPGADGVLRVVFARGEGFMALPPARLPPHQGAFALTVHRAQGLEFDAAMLVLPQFPARVLGRELLYTGLACARAHATLVGSAAVLEAALRWPARRCSGLAARLAEALRASTP